MVIVKVKNKVMVTKYLYILIGALLLLCSCKGGGTASPFSGEGDTIPISLNT